MADYMEDLFKKVKEKKGASPQEKEPEKSAEKPSMEKQAGQAPKPLIGRPAQKPAMKPEQKPATESQRREFEPSDEALKELERKVAERAAARAAVEEVGEKEAEKAEEKIIQIVKELPPQEKAVPESPESVPEEQKSEAEKELERGQRKEIDSYGTTKIYRLPDQPLLYYWTPVVRPVGAEKTIINTIKEAATRIVSIAPYKIRDQEQRRNVYYQKILEIFRDSPELNIPKTKYQFYADAVVREMVGYGIIDALINDDRLEEIMVIGPKTPVYVFHRDYEMMVTNIEFYSDNEIQDVVNRIARIVGRRVDLSSPLLDARLPDGSRVNATIPPASVQGSTLTIRKFREDPYSIVDLITNGTITTEVAAFLWLAAEGLGTRPANILISGGTGSGKTTTLNVLASFIPATDRIISIEDTAELNLPLKHWIRMEARPPGIEGTGELTMDILTKNSLRMRPDRIIVGEIRHAEAFTLFTAFNTGHDGSLGTVHANSPQETIVRVTSPPMNVPEVMMSGLNFIIVQHRLHDKKLGTIRRFTEIAEISNVLEGKTKAETIYRRNALKDTIERTKAPIKYLDTLQEMTGTTKKEIEQEILERKKFFERLVKEKKREMKTVSLEMQKFLISRR
ncbi:MAG TPA: ATPase, T2SS/T4P/T4SS family [archaeon]|nr:ATPase, T2SS/T4P/T4SS family [archaeon]